MFIFGAGAGCAMFLFLCPGFIISYGSVVSIVVDFAAVCGELCDWILGWSTHWLAYVADRTISDELPVQK